MTYRLCLCFNLVCYRPNKMAHSFTSWKTLLKDGFTLTLERNEWTLSGLKPSRKKLTDMLPDDIISKDVYYGKISCFYGSTADRSAWGM